MNSTISLAYSYAQDMGFSICPRCGTTYIAHGLPNEGHECPSGGAEDNVS